MVAINQVLELLREGSIMLNMSLKWTQKNRHSAIQPLPRPNGGGTWARLNCGGKNKKGPNKIAHRRGLSVAEGARRAWDSTGPRKSPVWEKE